MENVSSIVNKNIPAGKKFKLAVSKSTSPSKSLRKSVVSSFIENSATTSDKKNQTCIVSDAEALQYSPVETVGPSFRSHPTVSQSTINIPSSPGELYHGEVEEDASSMISATLTQATSSSNLELADPSMISMASLCKPARKKRKTKSKDDLDMGKEDKVIPTTSTGSSNPNCINAAGPRVRIVDGHITIDEESLETIDPSAKTSSFEQVEESHENRFINSASFMKKEATIRWTFDETQLFYDGLSKWGTDFELISRMFPNRSRKHVKLKYNKEERANPQKIDKALNSRRNKAQNQDETTAAQTN